MALERQVLDGSKGMKPGPALRTAVERTVSELNVLLSKDGGRLEVAEVTAQGTVKLRLYGACADCTGSLPPMAKGIEQVLRDQVPEVTDVVVLSP